MGGHRVYKSFDPRATTIKKAADDVQMTILISSIRNCQKGEEVALEDDYFKSRNLSNVDFYSGIIYRALGIPTDMLTVMFALGRLLDGLHNGKKCRESWTIGRPRQVYTGSVGVNMFQLKTDNTLYL